MSRRPSLSAIGLDTETESYGIPIRNWKRLASAKYPSIGGQTKPDESGSVVWSNPRAMRLVAGTPLLFKLTDSKSTNS